MIIITINNSPELVSLVDNPGKVPYGRKTANDEILFEHTTPTPFKVLLDHTVLNTNFLNSNHTGFKLKFSNEELGPSWDQENSSK